ncbi:MAG: M50 family metallopeptidase [Bacteroidia bacterium]|nr:M50 family metallopeptidase [Bacteroidia bacterium]
MAFLCVILIRLPIVGVFFRAWCTLIHEVSHALAALVLSQEVKHIHLEKDLSGTAFVGGGNKLSNTLIALVGYLGASSIGFAWSLLLIKGKFSYFPFFLFPIGVVSLLFWIRNSFGILWILGQLAVLGGLYFYSQPVLLTLFCGIVTWSLVGEAFYSNWIILKLSYSNPKQAGDSTLLHKFTSIPSLFWGILFFTFGFYLFLSSIGLLFWKWVHLPYLLGTWILG